MKSKRLSKKECERKHARQRALERYGIDYNRDVRREFLKKIANSGAKFICRQSNRVTVFDVEHEGQTVRFVYDSSRQEIITFLPKESNNESPHTT